LAAARQPAGADSGLVIRATIGLTGGVLATSDVPLTGDAVGQVDQVEWADVDGDGDLDVLVFGASGLFVAENEGASFAVHRLTSEPTAGAVTLDVDGAPPLELLVAFNPTPALDDERLVLHHLAGVDDFTLDSGAHVGSEFPDNLTRCQLQPGRAHIVAGTGTYPPTTGGVGARVPLPGGGGPAGCGDVDGDGWDDLVVGDGDAPIEVFLSRGGFQSTAAFTSITRYIARHIELGDVDGDGRLDIVVNDAYSPDQTFGYLRNTTQGNTISFEEAVIPDWDTANTNQRFDLGPTPAAAP
ncbi:MAG: VCBS repeat-containing protein, partial [Deltaproteobacteria bacterium]|nr:VCBS repeat-containing protein [Kofleriaceae bacterium]